jgi:hypothetical protein
VTGWKSGSPALNSSNMTLRYDASVPDATRINVTVVADTDGDGTVDATSDRIALEDGEREAAVDGISDPADNFRLRIEFETDSLVKGPSLDRIGVEEDS